MRSTPLTTQDWPAIILWLGGRLGPAVGKVWPGFCLSRFHSNRHTLCGGVIPLYKGFVSEGISGFWNDMNEPAVFGVPSKTMPDNISIASA